MEGVCQNTGSATFAPGELNGVTNDEQLVQLALDTYPVPDYSNHLISYEKLAAVLKGPQALNGNIHAHVSAYMRQHLNSPFIEQAINQIPGFRQAQASNLFHVSVLSTSSLEGVTLLGKSSKSTPIFVIKTPKPTFNVAHEASIGLSVANPLRELTPCFMYTYTYSHCSTPSYIGNTVVSWCESNGPGYTVLEYIPGKSIKEAASTLSVGELDKVLKLLFESLKIAYSKYRFIHGDLHYENVMVRDMGKEIKVEIGDVSVVTRYVPQIIDFGFSSAIVNQIALYSPEALPFFNDERMVSPLYDLARLTLTLAYKVQDDEGRVKTHTPLFRMLSKYYSWTGRDYARDAFNFANAYAVSNERVVQFLQSLYWKLSNRKYPPSPERIDNAPNMEPTPIYEYIDSCEFLSISTEPKTTTDLCDLERQGTSFPRDVRERITTETINNLMKDLEMPQIPRITRKEDVPKNYLQIVEKVGKVKKRAYEIRNLLEMRHCGALMTRDQKEILLLRFMELQNYLLTPTETNMQNIRHLPESMVWQASQL